MWKHFRDVGSTNKASKVLNIGLAGAVPWIYIENDEFKGSDMLMIKLLSEKLGFSYDLKLNNYVDLFKMVK